MTVLINGVEYVPAYRPKPGVQFESLGHALRTIRKSHKLSLEAAAKLAGCTKSHLWKLEKDGAEPGIRLAYRLSEAYGVPLLILALCAQVEPTKSQAPAQGTGEPQWNVPGSQHPERVFAEWLNEHRMADVSSVFHEIVARYRAALSHAPAAQGVGADEMAEVVERAWAESELETSLGIESAETEWSRFGERCYRAALAQAPASEQLSVAMRDIRALQAELDGRPSAPFAQYGQCETCGVFSDSAKALHDAKRNCAGR